MNDEQFIAEVKNLAELDADEHARKAIGATLETLKERLAGEEPSDLAAQLPPEIAPYVERVGGGESFSVEEFYERVAQKEGVGKEEAVGHARAVATVVQTAVTEGELDDIRSQLGAAYGGALRPDGRLGLETQRRAASALQADHTTSGQRQEQPA